MTHCNDFLALIDCHRALTVAYSLTQVDFWAFGVLIFEMLMGM